MRTAALASITSLGLGAGAVVDGKTGAAAGGAAALAWAIRQQWRFDR